MTKHVKSAFRAAREGDADALTALLDQGVSPDSADDDGDTLLSVAAGRGRLECVALLLRRGADPNGGDESWPPLWAATSRPSNAECTRLLIQHGADVNRGQPDDGGGYSLLMHCAAEPERLENLHELLRHSPELDSRNEEDESPLSYAIAYGNVAAVEALLDAGVDPNRWVCKGETPLAVAAGAHNETTNAIFHLLLDRGADVNVACDSGSPMAPHRSPLMWFVQSQPPTDQSVEVLRRMASLAKDINYQTRSGETALKLAQETGYKEYVDVLVEFGARSMG